MKTWLIIISLAFSSALFSQSSFHAEGSVAPFYISHTITPKQDFLALARIYNLAPKTIADFNSLYLGMNLTTGQVVKIPFTQTNFEQKTPGISNFHVSIPVYATAQNQTLKEIATRYKMEPALLRDWNNITTESSLPDSLVVGYFKIRKDQLVYLNAAAKNETAKKEVPGIEITKAEEKQPEPGSQPAIVEGQDFDSDKLLQLARKAAFDKKNYPLAIQLAQKALVKSPDYADIRIFLGRIYTWTDKLDSARFHFDKVIEKHPDYTDVYVAYADLEYWNDRPTIALQYAEKGLQHAPESKELLLKKAKILHNLRRPKEAAEVLEKLLKIDPKNTEARSLSSRIKDAVSKNKIGIGYDYTHFDKQFADPWHIVSLDYSRQTNIGSFGAHINYANRFKQGGLQYEVDAYPSIAKNLYSYVAFAYSNDVGIFPKYRGGFSLYAALPKSFEAEAGVRYLYFSDGTIIYTAALGKYYKSWLFTARTYLTPGESKISHSYNAAARYYFGGADDFIGVSVGTGISPDERPASILLNSNYKLITQRASAMYKRSFNKKNVVTLTAGWVNQEYLPKTKGNQIEAGLSYQIRI